MTRDAPIHELLVETRSFAPPAKLTATSNVAADAWERAAEETERHLQRVLTSRRIA